MKKHNILLLVGSLVLLICLLSSCTKERVESAPGDFGKAYFRIQEVDNDGKVMYSTITLVNVKN